MDNLVDYLVIIFFIVSAIASLFRKKTDKQKQKGAPKPQNRQQQTISKPEPKEREERKFKDPFEELTEMLNRKQPEEEEKSEVDEYFEHAIKQSSDTERSPQKIDPTRTIEFRKAEQEKEKLEYNLDTLNQVQTKLSDRVLKLKSKLKVKNELRDLILYNEILGKPKALRNIKNPYRAI